MIVFFDFQPISANFYLILTLLKTVFFVAFCFYFSKILKIEVEKILELGARIKKKHPQSLFGYVLFFHLACLLFFL